MGVPLALAAALALAPGCREPAADPEMAGSPLAEAEDPELRSAANALLPDIERLSGLEILEPVRLARESAEQVRAYVEAQLEAELPPAEIEGLRTAYSLLGLLPDTLDLRALLVELYTEQIVGYYDPDRRMLFVVEGVGRAGFEPVLAHELVHALQDQHANLDSLIARERGNDRQMAAQAALEGHATLVMFTLLAERSVGATVDPAHIPNPGPQLRAGLDAPGSQFPVFQRAPHVIREALLFPYAEGAGFVQAVWRAVPGNPPPLDSLLPQSTEQVLHPGDRFLTRPDPPVEIRFDGDAGSYENTLGQFETGLVLEAHRGPGADSLARDWAGDRYRVVESAAGTALVWVSVWDDADAAARFAAVIRSIAYDTGGLDAIVEPLEVGGRPAVRVIIGRTMAAATAAPRPLARVVGS